MREHLKCILLTGVAVTIAGVCVRGADHLFLGHDQLLGVLEVFPQVVPAEKGVGLHWKQVMQRHSSSASPLSAVLRYSNRIDPSLM